MTNKLLILLIITLSCPVLAKTQVIPTDPAQSFSYWQPHVIPPNRDALVARAHRVYQRLARSWDQSRLTPALHIVQSSAGPWAASLQDGNILLSKKALEVCFKYKGKGDDLLAFVLAHEMAHMRSNDLWHMQFFRLVGSQAPAIQKRLVAGIKNNIDNLERREAQADHDGIILMSTVGFDPFQIIDNKDFFTIWVENIWRHSCKHLANQSNEKKACAKAKTRALRTKAQLQRALSQSVLYELGIQSLVAKQYKKAQDYLQAFARDFPSRSVFEALGISHLMQAKDIHSSMVSKNLIRGADFFFPFALNTHAFQFSKNTSKLTRSNKQLVQKLQNQMQHHSELAIEYFEKSKKIDPAHRRNYLYLALSYLLSNNTFMARGIIQGQYEKKFGRDMVSEMLLALNLAFEGKTSAARNKHLQLIQRLKSTRPNHSTLSRELISYTLFRNYTALLIFTGKKQQAEKVWQQVARNEKKAKDSILFQMALHHIREQAPRFVAEHHALIQRHRIGDRLQTNAKHKSTVWFNGERFTLNRFSNGAQLLSAPNKRITNAWQETHKQAMVFSKIKTGMSLPQGLKILGLPNRRLDFSAGQYLAYDNLGVAFEIANNRITGWFLYENTQ